MKIASLLGVVSETDILFKESVDSRLTLTWLEENGAHR
jgi:hypothetical protein